MADQDDYVDLGLTCNTVCTALDRGLKGERLSELSGSVLDAIRQDCDKYPKQGRRTEQVERDLSSFPCKRR